MATLIKVLLEERQGRLHDAWERVYPD